MARKAKASDQGVRSIIGHLRSQLIKGWSAYLIAKAIGDARQANRINCAASFFAAVEAACLESAFLAMARLFDRHKDSVNIRYLVYYCEEHPKAFPGLPKKELLSRAAEHKAQLDAIAPIITAIRHQRDRTIAHLDRLHVNDPSEIKGQPPLGEQDIKQALRLVVEILNTYAAYLNPPEGEMNPEWLEPDVIHDMDYLIQLIARHNAECR